MSDEPPAPDPRQHTLHTFGRNEPGPADPDGGNGYLINRTIDTGTQTELTKFETNP